MYFTNIDWPQCYYHAEHLILDTWHPYTLGTAQVIINLVLTILVMSYARFLVSVMELSTLFRILCLTNFEFDHNFEPLTKFKVNLANI